MLLGALDQDSAGLEGLEVGCLFLGDAGEDLHLGALEDVDDERGQSARGERKLDLLALDPCGKDVLEEPAPTGQRFPPATGELLVCKTGGPELPENADEARVEVPL